MGIKFCIFNTIVNNKILKFERVLSMIVKNRLAVLRAEKGIRSISELQRMMKEAGYPIARKTLDRFDKNENNQIHYDTIAALCVILKCSVGELFTLVEEGE